MKYPDTTRYYIISALILGAVVFFIFLFQNFHFSPSKAQDNSLTLKIKLQGERYPNSTAKIMIDLYNPHGKVKEYTDVIFTNQADKTLEGTIAFDPSFDYNTLYAISIKPTNYFRKLFCSDSVFGTACKSPQFVFNHSANSVDLSKQMFYGGDIAPANGKADAYDISKIMANLGKSDDSSTDINNDGMTNSIDYLSALYSLSNNISDDSIGLVFTPLSPTPTMSPIPTSTPIPTPSPTIKPTSTPMPTPTLAPSPTPYIFSDETPVEKKVLVLDFNPLLESKGGKRLRTYKGWNDPVALEKQFISDIKSASHGFYNYKIVEHMSNIDAYPEKNNGFVFTDDSYLALGVNPDDNARAIINYTKLLTNYNVCNRVNTGEINELWIWGGPWFGYYEAVMAGSGAYSTNAPPITDSSCIKKLHILGFSYERGSSEMVEDFGHRTEGTMRNVFLSEKDTDWDRYTKTRAIDSSAASSFPFGCGTIHNPFNSAGDYDWGNKSVVTTTCDGWASYPPAPTVTKDISCSKWGCSGYGYIKMWLLNLPHHAGSTNGKWNNWWKYVADIFP